MPDPSKNAGCSENRRLRPLIGGLCRLAPLALSCSLGVNAAWATAAIINSPYTANPGDVITLEGSGFGTHPTVYVQPLNSGASAITPLEAQDNVIVVQIPATMAASLYTVWINDNVSSTSNKIALNAPQPFQFDRADINTNLAFRIYGRNMVIKGLTPTLTLVDTQTNAQLPATNCGGESIQVSCVAPAGVTAGHVYQAIVSNGYASALAPTTVLGHANAPNEYFRIGLSWGLEYIYQNGPNYRPGQNGSVESDHHIWNVQTDPEMTVHATGNGVTNDAPAIQAALEQVGRNGGGIVYLPPGTYNVGMTGLVLRPRTVLQGHSSNDTTIIYGPTTQQGSSFSMTGIQIPDNATLTGIADLSLKNLDQLSQHVVNLDERGQTLSKFFIQRVNWDLGAGRSLYFNGDRIAIENSTIHQANNNQNIQPDGSGGVGPIYSDPVSNLTFTGNTISWYTNENLFNNVVTALIDNNHFTRIADTIAAGPAQLSWPHIDNHPIVVGQPIQRTQGRPLTINFGKNILITNNTFDVANGPLYYNWNDGETILNEASGREDMGVLAGADGSSATAQPKSSGAWNYFSNSMIVIVSGKGAGQWRHITQNNGNSFTVDQPWLVIPWRETILWSLFQASRTRLSLIID